MIDTDEGSLAQAFANFDRDGLAGNDADPITFAIPAAGVQTITPISALPTIAGAAITGEVLAQEQGEKIYIQKFRRRKTYRKRTGHRQLHTSVRIESISGV